MTFYRSIWGMRYRGPHRCAKDENRRLKNNHQDPLATVIEKALRDSLRRLLEAGYWDFDRTVRSILSEDTPVVIMIVGVNGTGKTTTSAKIAHRLREDGYSVVMAAADTFRAGAIDQLSSHAERIGVRCITSQREGTRRCSSGCR